MKNNDNQMPKEIWAYEMSANLNGRHGGWLGTSKQELVKYTRLDLNEVVISRKSLEDLKTHTNSRCVETVLQETANNKAIDRVLELADKGE